MDTIPVEMFKKEVFGLLDETFERVPQTSAFLDSGTSLFETLATISAEEASRPVSPTCASLAAQVEHVRFYLEVMERAILGESLTQIDWGEIWRTVRAVTPEQWEDSKSRLMASYRHVRETLSSLPYDHADHVGGAMNVIVHTAYHLGEIRQALCTLHETQRSGVQHGPD